MSVADRLAGLSPEQRALFEKLREKQRQARPPQPPPLRRVTGPSGEGDWPLSYDQERLWFLSLLEPESTAYNMVSAMRLRGDLDVQALAAALREVVRRHAAWRTSFPRVDGRPVQRVAPDPSLPLPVVDLASLPAGRRRHAALELAGDDARRPFAVERRPLVRTTLVRLGEREHLCILSVHHIVSDFVSFQLVWHEIEVLYGALSRGRPSPLPELPVQFADFAAWQRGWMSGEVLRDQLDWWQEQLRGFPLFLELPADRPQPAAGSPRGARQHAVLSPGMVEGVRELARREGVTRFMAVTAVWAALLHRLSGQERLVTGTLNANRSRPELAPLLGFFLTQLPLPIDLSGDPTFRELLGRVRQVALGAFAHQDLPFGKLVQALQPERDLSRMPLVQTLVQLIDAQGAQPAPGALEIEAVDVYDGNARYDLMLALYELSEGIQGPLEYDADIFDASTAGRWLELFFHMTEAVLADPGLRLSALPAFGEAQRHQVLVEWNDSASSTAPIAPPTVVQQFHEQAARTPDAAAWRGDGWRLTYAELEERSNRLARHLRRLGAGPETLVGLFLDRDELLPVGLLGVLKSGAAYLPLDLAHPAARRALVLEDAGAPLIVTRERLLAELPDTAARTVCLDLDWETIAGESGEPPALAVGPENRAYVIYTSGSTGRPKGVEITHGALAVLLAALSRLYRVVPGDAMPGITTLAFDLSVPEIYLPMLGGGTTPLLSRETVADGVLLARALDAVGATVLQATPATYRQLLDSGWPGRPEMLLLCGAEALDRELADRLLPAGRQLWNFYGPTEATVWATAWKVEPGEAISIGRPLTGYQVHLLDPGFAPVPLGAEGEICIGGPGLARGYFGRPDLTAERFIPHPREPGARLYRTGDLARWLPGGLLRYAGRADHQMKLRGFRIEPGEIEAALRRLPAVSEAVVLRREDRPGDARLVAYLGLAPASEAPAAGELRGLLQGALPESMIPSAFVLLPALPRNANGKVDRKALSEIRPEPTAPGSGRVMPRTPVEELLAAIWSQVLEVEEVGAGDDFFALGGHSLLATRIVARIREAFGVELPLRSIFQAPTLAAQAELVASARAGASPRSEPIRPVPRGGDLPLSFAQERLWFLQQLDPASPAYNIPFVLRVTGGLDVPALERAFEQVAHRHETLRATFHDRGGSPVQRIAPPSAWTIPVTDLAAVEDPAGEVGRLAREDALAPFDLARGPLLRTRLLRLAPREHVLLLCIHHAVADLWALGILIEEAAALYEGRSPLPELPVQYPDFAVWQRGWLRGEELERQVAFWRTELAGAPAALDLPTDRPRRSALSPRGASLPAAFGAGLSEGVSRLGHEQGATPFMVLIAALGAVCARWAGQEDVVLGAPIANRQRPELEGLVGMFVNSLPLRVRTGGKPSFADLLARVRRTALDAYEHQDVPFEKLVEELRPPRDLGRHPLFQAVLALQNVRQGRVELPDLALEPLEIGSAVARFELTLTLFEGEEGLAGSVEWAADLFDAAAVERLLGSLKTFLAAAASSPETGVAALPLLSEGERRQVLVEWNDTLSPFPHLPVHELFAQQAALRPEAIAVEQGDERLTYRELQERAERVARRLRLKREQRVALLAERSPELIVNLLAILQAGGAYLPLDPNHPQERRDWMASAAGAVPLTLEETEADLPRVPPDSLAYVMYTSGSTGTPKGVAVTHRNVVRLVRGTDYAEMDHTWLQYAPVAFDASTLEIWGPLLNGGRLVLFPARIGSLAEIAGVIERHGVTSAWLTAGLFHEMVDGRLDGLAPLRQLLAGGDVLSPDHVRRVREAHPGLALINGYGPTEGTTFTCCHRVADVGETVPIGRPIANARAYVLDERRDPAPVGAWGELYAGGDGLARGYLGRPDLTAERFVPDPFGEGRLYRTGDRVRWRADGTLEFQGRLDSQLKIRGFRVEPGEVEAALLACPGLSRGAVAVIDKSLAAFWVGEAQADDLRARLRERLPESMVPSIWVPIQELPLTPNGKVDRRALAALAAEAVQPTRERVPPGTPLEEDLVEDWAEVLERDPGEIGIRDNFFDLGGHSLLATRLVSLLQSRHGLDVPLHLVFDTRDLAELADRIQERELGEADDELMEALLAEMGADE